MSSLPGQLPPEWLTQIKEAVKGSRLALILTTILGSSVISGILTAGLDYWILEPRRLQLSSQQRLQDARIDAHTKLAEQLHGFNQALNNSVLTCKIALEQAHDKELANYARQNLSQLSDRMISLGSAINQKIDADISNELKVALDRVGKALEKAQQSPKAFATLIDLYEQSIKTELETLLTKVEQKSKEIVGGGSWKQGGDHAEPLHIKLFLDC